MNDIPVPDKYALFETGGKQYQAIENLTLAVEKLPEAPGSTFQIETVLFKKDSDGSYQVGKPFLNACSITCEVVKHIQGKKVVAFKFKRRKKVRVKKGHRQPITVIRILAIN